MGLDPKLMAQLGLKRGSELSAPQAESGVLSSGDAAVAPAGATEALAEWGVHADQASFDAVRAAAQLDTSALDEANPGSRWGARDTADRDDAAGSSAARGRRGKAPDAPERTDRSILQQHRENRIASGSLRVPQVRVKASSFDAENSGELSGADSESPDGSRPRRSAKKKGRSSAKASSGGSRSRASGAAGDTRGTQSESAPQPVPPAPSWADVGAPPAWATDGELPERVTQILEAWDQREIEAAELIASGVEVVPDETASVREVIELTDDEALQLARAICLRLLTAMPRTRHELEKKLAERDVPAAAACAVLDRYEELGIVDDAAFAQAWVESRSRSKGFARGRLKQELRRKGVDGEDLELALEQIDSDQERERAEELALRKLGSRTLPPQNYGTPDAAERDKILRRVIGFLARKGYPGGMAMSAARAAMERHDAGER